MAYIHALYDFDIENDFGYGPTTSIFWNFCSFHCNGCWNSKTWDRQDDLYIDNDELVLKIDKALKSYNFKKELSLLGGDPLVDQNINDTLYVLTKIKELNPDLKIGVWTGFKWETLISKPDKYENQIKVLNLIDYLIDGPFVLSKKIKNRRYGSWNQRVIDVKQSLKQNNLIIETQYAIENENHIDFNIVNDLYIFQKYKSKEKHK